jgi:hypothetical protein
MLYLISRMQANPPAHSVLSTRIPYAKSGGFKLTLSEVFFVTLHKLWNSTGIGCMVIHAGEILLNLQDILVKVHISIVIYCPFQALQLQFCSLSSYVPVKYTLPETKRSS